MQPSSTNTRAEADAEFCATCSQSVDVAALAATGREMFPAKTKTSRAKSKTEPEIEDDDEIVAFE